jgi:hypothetical protein
MLGVTATALLFASGASSRPAAGINVNAQKPDVSLQMIDLSTGLHTFGIAVAARFTPEALHDEVRVTFVDLNGQAAAVPLNFRDSGNALHGDATYRWFFAAPEGSRILVTAQWRAYSPQPSGTVEGTKRSPIATVIVPKREVKPRFDDAKKRRLQQKAAALAASCMAFAAGAAVGFAIPPVAAAGIAMAAVTCAASFAYGKLARDPVDPRFRVIAKPEPPPAPRVAAGQGVPPAAAAALNRLFALQVKEIGLALAMLTAFDRAAGAYVKKQTSWERKQMLAAGTYARQLSALMLSEVQLRRSASAAFTAKLPVSTEEAYAYGDGLVARKLPASLASQLAKLRLPKAEQEEIRAGLAVIDPSLYDGDAADAIADPKLLSLLRQVAADMKAFSRTAAKNPLATRPP